MKTISSSLTAFYKFLVSSVIILFNVSLIVTSIWFLPKEHHQLYISFIPFSLICSSLVVVPLILLNEIKMDDEKIILNNFFDKKEMPIRDIEKINRFIFYFYVLTIINKGVRKKKIFMPKIREVIQFGVPVSVKLLIDKVEDQSRFNH
jgi:hypothetical protein